MKVLFLDIDGVLNNDHTKERFEDEPYAEFVSVDRRLLKLFMEWWEKRDIELVLSSSWRHSKYMTNYLIDLGLKFYCYTPSSFSAHKRRREIDTWLRNHPEVTHYAILDDIAVGGKGFVQTSPKHGVRQKNLDKLDKILETYGEETTQNSQ